MLRTSERGVFKRCRWLWWNEYVERRKPILAAPPLRFGTLIHIALAAYYKPGVKRGPHPAKTFAKAYEEEIRQLDSFGFKIEDLDHEDQHKWVEAGDLGEAMLKHYVDRYGKDEEWEVLVTEQTFQVLVHHPVTGEPWFWYVGTMDGVWRNRRSKKIHIADHKTTNAINVGYLSLDLQATGYWTWGLDWIYDKGLLKPDQRPAGMLYNHLRKQFPDPRPFEIVNGKRVHLNKDGSYSKKQPPPYFARTQIYRDWNEREQAREQVFAEFEDMQRVIADGPTQTVEPPYLAYKNQGQFTCPGCPAFDYCELHEIGADWHEMRELTTKTWDPYDAHEVYTAETK